MNEKVHVVFENREEVNDHGEIEVVWRQLSVFYERENAEEFAEKVEDHPVNPDIEIFTAPVLDSVYEIEINTPEELLEYPEEGGDDYE